MSEKRKAHCLEFFSGSKAFVDDFALCERVQAIPQKLVAVSGGSGIAENSSYCQAAYGLSKLLSKSDFSVITGGGSGIMNAGNAGAKEREPDMPTYGLRVDAITDEDIGETPFLDAAHTFTFKTLSVRLLSLIGACDAAVFFPGGFGTLEELFCLFVRIRVGMIASKPVYFYSSKFWSGLFQWMSSEMLGCGAIGETDLKLFRIEDDIEKIASEITGALNGVSKN
jgi:uncharacterized protein (TIGR00730 family)